MRLKSVFQMMIQDIDEFTVCRFTIQRIFCNLYEKITVSIIPAPADRGADAVLDIVPGGLEMGSYINVQSFINGYQVILIFHTERQGIAKVVVSEVSRLNAEAQQKVLDVIDHDNDPPFLL